MRTSLKILTPVLALAVLAAIFVGCGRQAPLAPKMTSARISGTAAAALPAPVARHFEGKTGPGSQYFLDVPPNWNRDLVVYAHGIVLPPNAPVGQPNYTAIRDSLLARGFAVAASSFDMNGYSLKDGYIRTHQLRGLFSSKFGPPART